MKCTTFTCDCVGGQCYTCFLMFNKAQDYGKNYPGEWKDSEREAIARQHFLHLMGIHVAQRTYKASFLHSSGAIECGFEIKTTSDNLAVLLAHTEATRRGAGCTLFGLHEVTGTALDGSDLIRTFTTEVIK